MKEIEPLQQAVTRLHGCLARHIGSEHVKEVFNNVVVWDGDVQIFELINHPKAKKCYAWTYRERAKEVRHVAVLEAGPVKSAQTAVRMSMMSDAQKI